MKVINLWAGPGAGKSTTAAGLFYKMKSAGKRVELVTEFAKELVYEKNPILNNQLVVSGQQDQRLRRLIGQVDYAITDTPLPLAAIYAKHPFDTPQFKAMIVGMFNTYDNSNFIIQRVKPYAEYGRTQSYQEARQLDARIEKLMLDEGILLDFNVMGDAQAPDLIFDYIKYLEEND